MPIPHPLVGNNMDYQPLWGMRWCSWLRHCATSWKVMGSVPDGVTGIFHWHSPERTVALGLTQPVTEMSTRNISWEEISMTFSLWRFWGCQPHTPAVVIPRKCSWYSFSLGAKSTPGHGTVGRNMLLKNPVTPPAIDPGTVRLVAQCLNYYTTPGPKYFRYPQSQH